jgi:Resolvase, N terminal domain
MGGTDPYGRTHSQPFIAPVGSLGPTTPKPDKSQVGFRSLTENIDTTTSGGKLVFHIFGALAEFERDIIRERTTAGLEAARARGRFGGRRPVMTPAKLRLAQAAMGRPDTNVSELCDTGPGKF